MKKLKIFKIVIGILFIFYSFYSMYDSFNMPTYLSQGLIFGQGSIFLLWGLREIIGGILE